MDNLIKIVVFTPAISRSAGGISNMAYYLATEFAKQYDVVVFTSLNDNERPDGISIVENSNNNAKKAIFSNLKHFYKFCKDNRNNDIRCVSMTWRSAIVPWILKSFFSYKEIILCHGDELLQMSGIKKIESLIRKRILSKVNALCCNSKYTAGLVRKLVDKVAIKIIHPCQGEHICKDSQDQHFILSIGRLEKRKGFQDVIEAVSIIKEKKQDIKYIIAGTGKYYAFLQNQITKYNLEDNCKLLGRVSEEEKKELLKNCSMLVMPSFYDKNGSVEGFGIVYIEANAYGKPVIGSYSGGIPDAIINGKTGLLVHERNVPELVDSIQSIINKDVIIDKNECYKWAEKNHYKNIAKEYLLLLSEL